MASCTQIERLLQAYIDDEASDGDRVIIEEHVGECETCQGLLRKQQRCSARLYEVFSEHRLGRDLTPSVMEHLPEMEAPLEDVAGLNWRAKHPARYREKLMRLIPIAAAVLLVILAGVIRENWPAEPSAPIDAIGMVLFSEGGAKSTEADSTRRGGANVGDAVLPGSRYETPERGFLMLRLAGNTDVKLNESSRVTVLDERNIRVEQGQALLNVGKMPDRNFRVSTPFSNVIVFGTTFDVRVDNGRTSVAVQEGKVQVERSDNQAMFCEVLPGSQVEVSSDSAVLKPSAADVARITRWAERITPDAEAGRMFAREIQPRFETTERAAEVFWRIPTARGTVDGIELRWKPTTQVGRHCGYEVIVMGLLRQGNAGEQPMFSERIPGRVFDDPTKNSYFIRNPKPQETRRTWDYVIVRAVPDFSEGAITTQFEVTGKVIGGEKKE